MKYTIAAIATIFLLMPVAHSAYAESIPDWIKNNAAWWADGVISENEFVQGIQYLIKENVLSVPPTAVSAEQSGSVPDWVKNNAAWWAAGTITDEEFLNGIQHLIKIGIITVASESAPQAENTTQPVEATKTASDSELAALEAELEACQEIKKAYDRLKCEDKVEAEIIALDYKNNAQVYSVGPINFYFMGADLEVISAERANLSISMLVENTSSDNVSMFCSGPSVCNYDVVAGNKVYKYSSQDFTNGQIVVKPGESKEFNMLFGPNIGYGGTEFQYDPAQDYSFRISEPWGSAQIPLGLG